MSAVTELPQFLRDMLAAIPTAGNGVHNWLFNVSRHLHAHRDRDDIVRLLVAMTEGCGRRVQLDEIEAAVDDAWKVRWQPNEKRATTIKPAPKWPPPDQAKRTAAIQSSAIKTLVDLCEASPMTCTRDSTDAEFFVDWLFPGNPLLCVGLDMARFTTAPREDFRGRLHEQSLIVPSPMSAVWGARKCDGKKSMHTLSNTGPRKYLVTEFDSGTPDEQAGIIWHLREFAPLTMVLSSGGKSCHAWFNCQGTTEETQRRFFRYAVSLGADPATWTRSQFVRLPQGWRADKQRHQEVFYFNHELAEEGRAL